MSTAWVPPWRAGIFLTCILALVLLGCAPAPANLTSSTPSDPAALAYSAPLQLLVFYSPL